MVFYSTIGEIDMKTRYFGIWGVILVILGLFGFQSTAHAQNAVSDTITTSLSGLRNFGTLDIGQTECHTIFLQNVTATAYVINSVTSSYNNQDFKIKAIPALPAILLPGEIVSITDLCFAPLSQPPDTAEDSYFQLTINYTVGSNSGQFYASCLGFHKADTLLRKPCVAFSINGDLFGPIIMDGDVSHTVTMQSNRRDTLWVGSAAQITGGDSLSFSISDITFPYKLSPLEARAFNVTYSPRSNTPNVKFRAVAELSLIAFTSQPIDSNGHPIYYWGQCSGFNFTLPGVAIPPTADSIATALAAGSTDVLAMIGDNSVTTKTFHFTNTGTTNLKITAVSLKNGKSFAITDIQPTSTLPFTLTPGQSMSVTIAMTTVSNGVYYDEVTITAEQALISMNFQLQGLRKNVPLGVHNTSAITSHATLYPNPTTGSITIAMPGIRNAKIEVLDILGNVITTTTASELWNYDCTEPAGTYFVHISGTEASGKPFQSYDRFIVQK